MNKKAMTEQVLVIIIVALAAGLLVFAVGTKLIAKTDKMTEGFSDAHNKQQSTKTERNIFDFEACTKKGACTNFNEDISGILRRQPYDTTTKIGAIIHKNPGPYVIIVDDKVRAEMNVQLCISNQENTNQQEITELYHDKTNFIVNGNKVNLKNEVTGDIFEPEGDKLCLRQLSTP